MFINVAQAQEATATAVETATTTATTTAASLPADQAGLASMVMTFAPLVLVILIFYIFVIRPQNRRMVEYQKQISTLRRGDRVVTTGGIIGTIHRIEAGEVDVHVEVAPNVVLTVQKSAIAEILAKTGTVDKKK